MNSMSFERHKLLCDPIQKQTVIASCFRVYMMSMGKKKGKPFYHKTRELRNDVARHHSPKSNELFVSVCSVLAEAHVRTENFRLWDFVRISV